MSELTPSQIVDRLRKQTELLYDRCIVNGLGLWTVWSTFNDLSNPLRDETLSMSKAARVLNLMNGALLTETMMIIARALDASGRSGANHTNRVSYRVMSELSNLPGVRDEIESRARTWFDGELSGELKVANVLSALQLFQEKIASLADECPNRLQRIKNFRDDHIAHNLIFEDSRDTPLYGDLTTLLMDLRLLHDLANQVFTGGAISWREFEDDMRSRTQHLCEVILTGHLGLSQRDN